MRGSSRDDRRNRSKAGSRASVQTQTIVIVTDLLCR